MKGLNQHWLTEGLIDFEYKKYILMAYLQGVSSEFEERKLYPVFSDLLFHYSNLTAIKQNKTLLREHFPKQLTGADFEKLQLAYKEMVQDDRIMSELEEIINYAMPRFQDKLGQAKEIFEEVEQSIRISPIGLSPLNNDAGYMLFYVQHLKQMQVYGYEITIFQNADEKFRGVHTHHVETLDYSPYFTFESVKVYLIRKYPALPNPATYLIDAKINYPFTESLMPVAKRMLVRYIAKAA